MKAMVLCAGFGTRLRPLTDRIPKPLVPLCGVPLLRYNFALLKNAGVSEVVVNTHHLGKAMEEGATAVAKDLGLALHLARSEAHPRHRRRRPARPGPARRRDLSSSTAT